jgi:oligopeptide/dipeptide ABC transporter ATP-binding protein
VADTVAEHAPGIVLELQNVKKFYPVRNAPLSLRPQRRLIHAVDDVNLKVSEKTAYGIVGESGSGKSTLARLVVRLTDPSAGSIRLRGNEISTLSGNKLRLLRKQLQIVFQDPYSSFDPSTPLVGSVTEPVEAFEHMSRGARRSKAAELFDLVGLPTMMTERYPREMSGGQLQRAAIARALSTQPELVVLDEPVSSLDLSTQGQIISLLMKLQLNSGVSYIFIAHNLDLVRVTCDRVAVMYLGQFVEDGETETLYQSPKHPYTAALLDAAPKLLAKSREAVALTVRNESPSAVDPPAGCRFRSRCPWAMDICSEVDPPAYVASDGSVNYCHLHTHGPKLEGESIRALSLNGKRSRYVASGSRHTRAELPKS